MAVKPLGHQVQAPLLELLILMGAGADWTHLGPCVHFSLWTPCPHKQMINLIFYGLGGPNGGKVADIPVGRGVVVKRFKTGSSIQLILKLFSANL
jgi:hypothetical protein